MNHPSFHRQRGASLIEAMVALAITALGLLTFIGLHFAVRSNADIAKQRSEAVRIAQQDLENIRVFSTDGATSSTRFIDNVITNLADSVRSPGIPTSVPGVTTVYSGNATYTLTRSVSTPAGADYSEVRVQVAWIDRQNQAQQVVLRNVIGRVDPGVAASLFIKPNGSPVRDTLGRNIQVPIPAKNLGDGKSVFKPNSANGLAVVFDNDTGLVVQTCTAPDSKSTAQLEKSDLSCNDSTPGYLISGFVRFKAGSFNKTYTGDFANDPPPDRLPLDNPPVKSVWKPRLDLDNAAPPPGGVGYFKMLTPGYWPAMDAEPNHEGYAKEPVCESEWLKTISYTANVNLNQQNNGTTTTITTSRFYLPVPAVLFPDSDFPSGGGALSASVRDRVARYAGRSDSSSILSARSEGENYVGYSCVVYPADLDSPQDKTLEWSGRLTLVASGVAIGTGSKDYKVCRFSQDYNRNGYVFSPDKIPSLAEDEKVERIDNEEHPYAYLMVRRSLSNQNFLVIEASQTCPTDKPVEVNGQGDENYTDATTVTHQP